jgi:hypothetical protein
VQKWLAISPFFGQIARSCDHRHGLYELSSEGFGGSGGVSKQSQADIPMMNRITISPAPTPKPPPTPEPTPPPVAARNITYMPGLLNVQERDLFLSQGLKSEIIAVTGSPVLYANGASSNIDFHVWPDGAAVFEDYRPGNPGGWIYVSNSEAYDGGVGALTFNKDGGIIDYKMVLTGTDLNCNGW